MKTQRWALALLSAAALGSVAVIAIPGGIARADVPTRFALSAQGDAMYYEVVSESIPASPNNTASSLIASADLSNSSSTSFASTPYYGSTLQNFPGTANGVPGGFGAPKELAFPFSRLPGYVETRCPSLPEAKEDQGYGRVSANCSETSAEAHGSQGAPPSVPAPNQQETADALAQIDKGVAKAEASGSATGFASGPLEVGNSTAKAVLNAVSGKTPTIESATFGRFSIGGQEFGFDKSGFRYLGQGMSQKEALEGANSALTAAGISLEVAPVEMARNEQTGKTTYTIGGLRVSQICEVPGAASFTVTYILGRASVSGVNVALGLAALPNVNSKPLGVTEDKTSTAQSDAGENAEPSTSSGPVAVEAAMPSTPEEVGDLQMTNPIAEEVADPAQTQDGSGAIREGAEPVDVSIANEPQRPRRLGLAAASSQAGGSSEGFYLMLVIAGAAVLVMQQAFSRFGVRMISGK